MLQRMTNHGLTPRLALDLTTNDPETSAPWDLSDGKVRNKVVKLIKDAKPFMIICSPMCTAFSQIQALNVERRDPGVVRRELESAKDHVRWTMKICATQVREGRYFLFEHPRSASSWKMLDGWSDDGKNGHVRLRHVLQGLGGGWPRAEAHLHDDEFS